MNNKYQNAKIYKLVDIGYNKCYIGSTCNKLSSRMAKHRMKYRLHKSNAKYQYYTSFILFDEFGVENVKIELLEDYPCDNRENLLKREGEYIRSIECVNKKILTRTKAEYNAMYAIENKDRILKYRIEHKEEKKQTDKLYRDAHKDELNQKLREQIECAVCRCCISKRNKATHENSKKHQDSLNNLSNAIDN